jgi:hypothetical protein
MAIFMRHMGPLIERLFHALALALPHLSARDLFWRTHFAMGSLGHVMRCHERHAMVPENIDVDLSVEELVESFLDFAAAGMEVPK